METKLYLIRHGQSEGNLNNFFLGHTDLDLTPLGHEQAEMTANYLSSIPADVIYSSDLKRAYHTALHTAEQKGLPVICDENLREIFAGKWEKVSFPSLRVDFEESFGVWMEDFPSARCPDGESIEELWNRVTGAVQKIARENEGKTVFIFTHATPIRLLQTYFSGLSLKETDTVPWPTNASVTSATYENGVFSPLEFSVDFFMGEKATSFGKGTV